MTNAYYFWKNVDNLLMNTTLVQLAEKASINYKTVKNQRSYVRLPNLEDAYAISQALGTTVEHLLTGKISSKSPYSEYLPYIERLDKYDPEKLRVVREILGMASLKTEPERKIFFASTKEVN